MISIRPVATDGDADAWLRVRRVVQPNESAGTVELVRERAARGWLYLLAELEGVLAGSGAAGPSDAPARAFVAPRVLPEQRRRGVGRALLHRLGEHAAGLGVERVHAHVDDDGSKAFAECFGFQQVDGQVEQVLVLDGVRPASPLPPGVDVTTIAEGPGLLESAYPLAVEGWADFATDEPVTISREDWLRDEATLPAGSFVALVGGEVVGYSGLCRHDEDGVVEDGLTVVRRDWRGRGLARGLKERELAWAAAAGYREVVTWTQQGNGAMRALNDRLGYVYRGESSTMEALLPLTVGP